MWVGYGGHFVFAEKIVCYFGSWAVYRPGNGNFDITEFDATLCTHLIYTFVGLKDGLIKVLDPYADLADEGGKNGFGHFVKLREQSPSTKFLMAIGGWNEGSSKFSELVGDPGKRKAFVQDAVKFVKKYGFDGLDFDWEYPNQRGGVEADKRNFILMLKELRESFDKENLLLTAAFGASQETAKLSYILPQVTKYVDFVNLMTYDFHGIADKKTGMNAPLFSTSAEKDGEELLNVVSFHPYSCA
jgi:chitinase